MHKTPYTSSALSMFFLALSLNPNLIAHDWPLFWPARLDFLAGDELRSFAVCDFDEDGHEDLAVASQMSNNISILLGAGDGSFADASFYGVGNEPFSVAVGDFDNDGNYDLAVANYNSDNISILLGCRRRELC